MLSDDSLTSLQVLVLTDVAGDDAQLTALLIELAERRMVVDCIFVTGSLTSGDPRSFNDTRYIAELLTQQQTVLQTLRQIAASIYFVQGANDPILTIRRLSQMCGEKMLPQYPDSNDWCVDVSFHGVRLARNLVIVGSSGAGATLDACTQGATEKGANVLWSDAIQQEIEDMDARKKDTPPTNGASKPHTVRPTSPESSDPTFDLTSNEFQTTFLTTLQSLLFELNITRSFSTTLLSLMPSSSSTAEPLKSVNPRLLYTKRTPEEIKELIVTKHIPIADHCSFRDEQINCPVCSSGAHSTYAHDKKEDKTLYPPYPFGPFYYPYTLKEGLDAFDLHSATDSSPHVQYVQAFNDYVVDSSSEWSTFLTLGRKSAQWLEQNVRYLLYEPDTSRSRLDLLPSQIPGLFSFKKEPKRGTNRDGKVLRSIFASNTSTEYTPLPLHYSLEDLQVNTALHDEYLSTSVKFVLGPHLLNPTEMMYARLYGPFLGYNVDNLPGSALQKLLASGVFSGRNDESDRPVNQQVDCALDDVLKKDCMMKHTVTAVRDGTTYDLASLYQETCNIVEEFSSSDDASPTNISGYIRSVSNRYARDKASPIRAKSPVLSLTESSSSLLRSDVLRSPAIAPLSTSSRSRAGTLLSSGMRRAEEYSNYLKGGALQGPAHIKSLSTLKSPTTLTRLSNSLMLSGMDGLSKADCEEDVSGWLRLSPQLYDALPKGWTDWCNLRDSTGNALSSLYLFDASHDSVILLSHQGPAGSPTSYELDEDTHELLETGSYSLRDLHSSKLNLLLHVHGRARRPLLRLYDMDGVSMFNPGSFKSGLYGLIHLVQKGGVWQVSSATIHKLQAREGS